MTKTTQVSIAEDGCSITSCSIIGREFRTAYRNRGSKCQKHTVCRAVVTKRSEGRGRAIDGGRVLWGSATAGEAGG